MLHVLDKVTFDDDHLHNVYCFIFQSFFIFLLIRVCYLLIRTYLSVLLIFFFSSLSHHLGGILVTIRCLTPKVETKIQFLRNYVFHLFKGANFLVRSHACHLLTYSSVGTLCITIHM